jgi:hypothetical protein
MSVPKVQPGVVGLVIVYQFLDESGNILNISTATGLALTLQGPPRSGIPTVTKPATFLTDGTDGSIQYTTVVGDIPFEDAAAGAWRVKGSMTLGAWSGFAESASFQVDEPMV